MKNKFLLFFLFLPFQLLAQTNTDGVITIGRNALYYEDYALSIQYFNEAIQAKPYLYEPYYFRAVAKYYLGDYYGAVEDCSASIDRDPFVDDCYKLRAINYIMVGKYHNAIDDYRHLINQQSDSKDFWYNMVLCQTQLDSLNNADKLLDTMIVKWPNYARCYLLKAQIAMQRKDTTSADTLLDHALKVSPFDVDTWAAKAMILIQQNDFKNAEMAYDKAILQSPKESGFYLNRALARFRQNNLRGAMDDYDIALDIDPENYLGHYNRGLLRMQVGENNLAITDFDFVLKKEPKDRLALFNRATLSELTGNFRAAIRDYTTVLRQYPYFLTGYQNRSRCYRKIGDNKHALADERHIYIAQLNSMFGSHKKNHKYTRKQKEQNIDDYQKLVVNNDEDNIAKFYSSDYRGRIQNKNVAVELQPIFIFTFSKVINGLSKYTNYATFVEKINLSRQLPHKLYLSSREAPSDANDIQSVHNEIAQITAKLNKEKNNSKLRFNYAIYLFFERNYTEALEELTHVIKIDSTNEAALFLRSIIRIRQADINQYEAKNKESTETNSNLLQKVSKASDKTILLLTPALQDLTRAIHIDPNCAYLYYNRGCIYAKIKDNQNAVNDFTRSIKLNSALGEAYYNRGLLDIELQNFQQGFEDLGKAGELGLYSAYSLIKHFRKIQNSIIKQESKP